VNEQPNPSVAAVITVNDMYHELQGLRIDVQTLAGKVDTIPVQINALQATSTDHATRIDALEMLPGQIHQLQDYALDHEKRMRVAEGRKYVSPATLYAAVTLAVACLGVLVAFLAIKGN